MKRKWRRAKGEGRTQTLVDILKSIRSKGLDVCLIHARNLVIHSSIFFPIFVDFPSLGQGQMPYNQPTLILVMKWICTSFNCSWTLNRDWTHYLLVCSIVHVLFILLGWLWTFCPKKAISLIWIGYGWLEMKLKILT